MFNPNAVNLACSRRTNAQTIPVYEGAHRNVYQYNIFEDRYCICRHHRDGRYHERTRTCVLVGLSFPDRPR
jgi:hypothetical protein